MQNIRFLAFLLTAGVCMMLCHSCSTCSRQQTTDGLTIDLADLAIDSAYINMAQRVFYALPTPIEMSMLIKSSGIAYKSSLLNDPSNASKYLTNYKMALNFGVYMTDLAYAGLFEQAQTVLRYRQAIQQLTERLGLQSALDINTLQQLEASINNKDEVLRIISDAYTSCTASLNEDDRYYLTLAILTGGWIEGMYIATSMISEKLPSDEALMKQLVTDQKITFDMMWFVMSELKEKPEVAELMTNLSELSQLFDMITVEQTPNTVTVIEAGDGTVSNLVSTSVSNVTPELYAKIKEQLFILRQNFTKK